MGVARMKMDTAMTLLKNTFFSLPFVFFVFVLHAIYLNCIAEDAYISFRFAQNFSNGHGLLWNISESPVEGYTNFLWVMVCAVIEKLKLNAGVTAQIIGVCASFATIVMTYRFSTQLLGCRKEVALIPCVLLAVSGPFAAWSSSGMETNFFGLWVLMGCYYFSLYQKSNLSKHLYLCYLSVLVATLTRPEGIIIFSIVFSLHLISFFKSNRENPRLLFTSVSVFVVPFLVYFFWRYNYYGFLLPNTYYAKTGGTYYQYLRGAAYIRDFFIEFLSPALSLCVAFLWVRWKSLGQLSIKLIKGQSPLALCILICSIYIVYIGYVGGDYMHMYRFFVPILPLIFILLGQAFNEVISSVQPSTFNKTIAGCFLFLMVGFITLQSTPLEKSMFKGSEFHHGTFGGIEPERWHSARLILLGKFFREYRRSPNESLATGAIGAIGYFSDMKIYGFNGLVDTHISHLGSKEGMELGQGFPGHEKSDSGYTLSKRPTYYMFSRDLTESPVKFKFMDNFLERHYEHVSVWLVDEENQEKGYFTFLALKED